MAGEIYVKLSEMDRPSKPVNDSDVVFIAQNEAGVTESKAMEISDLRSLLNFENAFTTTVAGLAVTSPNQIFYVYTDSQKLSVNPYYNRNGIAEAITDSTGDKLQYTTLLFMQKWFTYYGYSLIKEVPSFAALRTLPVLVEGQKVKLRSYYADGTTGGGEFIGRIGTKTDDGGMYASGNGFYWEREKNGDLTIIDFGGVPSTDDSPVDISTAFNAAKLVTPVVKFPPNGRYYTKVPLTLLSNTGIAGGENTVLCSFPAVNAAGSDITSILVANNVTNISVTNITLDGGVREVNRSKNYTRPVKITNTDGIVFDRLTIINNADWSFSIESCKNIRVTDYKQKSYVYTDTSVNLNGGRDGSHFMDCTNVYMNGAVIDSGDDCVGITSKLSGCKNIQIRNITGSSKNASIVIYNEEQQGGVYFSQPCDKIDIQNVKVMDGGTARDVVRVYKYGADSVVSNITVKGVAGTSSNHAAYFRGITGLYLSDINVTSTQQHGIHISDCTGVFGDCKGAAQIGTFHGVSIFNSSYVNLEVTADGSAGYGCVINGGAYCTIVPLILNCGAGLYATKDGGGVRIVNSNNVKIPSGVIYGDTTKNTYIGVAVPTGQTNIDVDINTAMVQAVIPFSGVAGTIRQSRPIAAIHIKEDSSGNLIVGSGFNCTAVKNAVGNYTFTITNAAKNTYYYPMVCVAHQNAVRNWKQMSAFGTSSLNIGVVDSAGALTYSDHIYVMFYDAP